MASAVGAPQIALGLCIAEGEATMNCDEFRKELLLAKRLESLTPAARGHFIACRECQTYVEEQDRLRVEMRSLATSEHAPQRLRDSVADLFRQPSVRKQNHIGRWAAIAAAVLFVLGIEAAYV